MVFKKGEQLTRNCGIKGAAARHEKYRIQERNIEKYNSNKKLIVYIKFK